MKCYVCGDELGTPDSNVMCYSCKAKAMQQAATPFTDYDRGYRDGFSAGVQEACKPAVQAAAFSSGQTVVVDAALERDLATAQKRADSAEADNVRLREALRGLSVYANNMTPDDSTAAQAFSMLADAVIAAADAEGKK